MEWGTFEEGLDLFTPPVCPLAAADVLLVVVLTLVGMGMA